MFSNPLFLLLCVAFVLEVLTFTSKLDQRVPVLLVIVVLLVQFART